MELQWSLILFTALTGASGWAFACLALDEFKGLTGKDTRFAEAVVALVVLCVGGIASVTHLAHPERMLNALGHPTSGIFTEAALVGVIAVLAVVYIILNRRSDESTGAQKAFAVLAAVFGVLLSFMAGYSYLMPAQQSWNTVLLPLGYLGTAIPAGVSLYAVVAAARGASSFELVARVLGIGGVVGALTAAAYALVAGSLDGFSIGAIVLAGAVPAVIGFAMAKKDDAKSALLAFSCSLVSSLIGAILFRCLMWAVGSGVNSFFDALL